MSAEPVRCEKSTTGSTSMPGYEYQTSHGTVYRCEFHSDATPDPAWKDVRSSLRLIGSKIMPALTQVDYNFYTFKWIPQAMKEWRESTGLTKPEVLQTALNSDLLEDAVKEQVEGLWTKATSATPPTRTPMLCGQDHTVEGEGEDQGYESW